MSMEPRKDKKLQQKLATYEVNVPEFPLKKNRWNRLIHYLASPAKNPFEKYTQSFRGIALLQTIPIVGALLLALFQMFVIF